MKISLQDAALKLQKAHNIVLAGHINPDGDTIGSTLGLGHFLKEQKKNVICMIDDDIPKNFSILPGIQDIVRPERDEHDAIKKIKADILVVLDTAPDRIGEIVEAVETVEASILNLDHHKTNMGEGVSLYLDAERAATAEIVYELIQLMTGELSSPTALCLYTGIATDTGFFRYSNVTPYTMRIAANLLELGVKPHIVSEAMEEKPYQTVKDMATAMETIELFAHGKAAGIFLDHAITTKLESTDGLIDMIRVIDGVDVAMILKSIEPNLCRVSMRSKKVDVSAIAESFGGGGHIRAAGATIKQPFEEAKMSIISKVIQAIGEI